MGNKKLEIFDLTKGCFSAPDLTKDHHQFKLIRSDHFLIQLIMPAISNTMLIKFMVKKAYCFLIKPYITKNTSAANHDISVKATINSSGRGHLNSPP